MATDDDVTLDARLLDELADLRKRDARCRRIEEGSSRIADQLADLSNDLEALGDDE